MIKKSISVRFSFVRIAAISALCAVAFSVCAMAADAPKLVRVGNQTEPKVALWLESSLKRVFPNTPPGPAQLNVLSARNATVSFQACVRNDGTRPLRVDCKVVGSEDLKPLVRFVGLVPMPHFTADTDAKELDGLDSLPGLVPDPLLPTANALIGQRESRSYWITLHVPADAKRGVRELKVQFHLGDKQELTEIPVTLDISSFVVQPRHDFPVVHWWRGEATWDYYKTGMFEDPRWWQLTRGQLEDMLAHGSDVVYVPLLFSRREIFKRPCQLLIVNENEPGKYTFDWSQVKRFTDMCRDIGFKQFEWSHLWIYWGVEHPMRIYTKKDGAYVLLWPEDEAPTGEKYVNFLRQFLPEFHNFLVQEGLLESSYFHLSDEPGNGQHVENYKRARKVLRDIAPWMKVMDALSNVEYGKQHLTDMPIPMVNAAQAYRDAGIPHWVYFCCSPKGPWVNRFMDTPLAKVRMSGWLFYHLEAKGFLHWGFNYWHLMEQEKIGDPFTDASNGAWPGIPYGDPFVIYPGKDGPIDSIRWEVFAESLQDYAILQTAGIRPDAPLLAPLKSFADFPKDEQWINHALENILKSPANEP